jgi:hypothetical protein
MEEGYRQLVRYRSIDPGDEVIKIVADPIELKTSESGEESACQRRRTSSPVRATSNAERDVTIASGGKYPE